MLTARETMNKQKKVKLEVKKELTKLVEDVLKVLSEDYEDTVDILLGENFYNEALDEVCDTLRQKGYKYCLIEKTRVCWSEPDEAKEQHEIEETNFYLRISIKHLF